MKRAAPITDAGTTTSRTNEEAAKDHEILPVSQIEHSRPLTILELNKIHLGVRAYGSCRTGLPPYGA